MILDKNELTINSEMIVYLAEQALHNLDKPVVRRFKQDSPYNTFRHQFGTVKIRLPRRSGHSTAALQLLYKHPGSLLFVHNMERKYALEKLILEYTSNEETIEYVKNSIVVPFKNALLRIRPVKDRPFLILDQSNEFPDEVREGALENFRDTGIVVELQ